MLIPLPSLPEQGQLVSVNSRLWVVNAVRPSTLSAALKPTFGNPQHMLILSSVEDDGPGEETQVVWEIEPEARVIGTIALSEPTPFDPPDKLDTVRCGVASPIDDGRYTRASSTSTAVAREPVEVP
jgi:hypothetical protein